MIDSITLLKISKIPIKHTSKTYKVIGENLCKICKRNIHIRRIYGLITKVLEKDRKIRYARLFKILGKQNYPQNIFKNIVKTDIEFFKQLIKNNVFFLWISKNIRSFSFENNFFTKTVNFEKNIFAISELCGGAK